MQGWGDMGVKPEPTDHILSSAETLDPESVEGIEKTRHPSVSPKQETCFVSAVTTPPSRDLLTVFTVITTITTLPVYTIFIIIITPTITYAFITLPP